MEMCRTGDLIEVLLSNFELKKYNLTVEHMAQHKPFTTKLIEELMDKATEDYGMEFDIDCCELNIQPYGEMNIYISFREKSNIACLENNYTKEAIIDSRNKGKRKYFGTLRNKGARNRLL